MTIQWLEISVEFSGPDPFVLQDLIYQAFDSWGMEGVVLDEPGATGLAFGREEEVEELSCGKFVVTGYLADLPGARKKLAGLEGEVKRLCAARGASFSLSVSRRLEEEWEKAWKEFFHPVRVGESILVQPSWERVEAPAEKIVITLDPGMAFGTGAHPTTTLAMELLEAHLRPGMRVLDVGCGSGILMVLAYKLGASFVAGIDCDEVAVRVAGENLELNAAPETCRALWQGDLVRGIRRGAFGCVAANITAEPVIALVDQLPDVLLPGALFIASGVITEKWPKVFARLEKRGFSVTDIRHREGWVGAAAVYEPAG
ncbi:MAG: 50S ribosomal protein L11 methyltransferase [Deltaproteobacteria bacterium]|nr:50S ribosomal protein L11 methyltransferase [Deltaproteobacteria bacterium]